MLLVPCPNCGPRDASDFSFAGETHSRPDPNTASPEEWRNYLYMRDNEAGWQHESWFCSSGCRRWFKLERNTVTNEFRQPPLAGFSGGTPE